MAETEKKVEAQAVVVEEVHPGEAPIPKVDEVKPKVEVEVKPKVEDSSTKVKLPDPPPLEDEDLLNKLVEKKRLKKIGKLYVDTKFDPALTEEYKALRDEHLSNLSATQKEMEKLKTQLGEVTKKLSSKEELETAERQTLQTSLDQVKAQLDQSEKEFKLANVKLLRTQEATVKELPFTYLKYVKGETPEEITASVQEVLTDYNLNKGKISQEELAQQVKAAAETAKKETEEALKARARGTEGAGVEGHIYTRGEIQNMSLAEYQQKRAIIQKQMDEGLIK